MVTEKYIAKFHCAGDTDSSDDGNRHNRLVILRVAAFCTSINMDNVTLFITTK